MFRLPMLLAVTYYMLQIRKEISEVYRIVTCISDYKRVWIGEQIY
jgi:hypothetical protein